ncbi:MAG: hypothetical protein GX279_04485 [Clostridiaceae bacterium]|jgi:hypothetical protein|nr:hypothetical protein [Clostridiaceae bacterium]
MNTYQNISNELKSFFDSNKFFKMLLPLDIIVMFVGLALILLNDILGISIGSFLSALSYWAFIVGLLLTYANLKEQFLYIGLFSYGGICFINVLIAIFGRLHYLNWYSLFRLLIFGGLGYLVLRRTMVGSTGAKING